MTAKFMTLEQSRASGWSYYQKALKGEDCPIHPHHAPIGFFRKWNRHKDKSWPVAIWVEGDKKYAQIGSGDVINISTEAAEQDFIHDTFQWCSRNAIAYTVYEHWKANREWPPETGAAAVIEASRAARAEAAGIGHNSGEDPVIVRETFLDQVRAALAGVARFAAVDSDKKAGEAQSLRSRLSELAGEGDKLRADEKEPHLRASREVDEKWMPTIREAKAGAAELKKAIEAHATAKMRAEREAARLAAEQEQQRLAAEEAARRPKVTQASTPETQPPPAPAADPAPTPSLAQPAASNRIAGSYGRATSAKVRKEIDTIDYRKVCDQFVDTNPELQALLRKIADRVIAIGGDVRGVTTRDVARIR